MSITFPTYPRLRGAASTTRQGQLDAVAIPAQTAKIRARKARKACFEVDGIGRAV